MNVSPESFYEIPPHSFFTFCLYYADYSGMGRASGFLANVGEEIVELEKTDAV